MLFEVLSSPSHSDFLTLIYNFKDVVVHVDHFYVLKTMLRSMANRAAHNCSVRIGIRIDCFIQSHVCVKFLLIAKYRVYIEPFYRIYGIYNTICF